MIVIIFDRNMVAGWQLFYAQRYMVAGWPIILCSALNESIKVAFILFQCIG